MARLTQPPKNQAYAQITEAIGTRGRWNLLGYARVSLLSPTDREEITVRVQASACEVPVGHKRQLRRCDLFITPEEIEWLERQIAYTQSHDGKAPHPGERPDWPKAGDQLGLGV